MGCGHNIIETTVGATTKCSKPVNKTNYKFIWDDVNDLANSGFDYFWHYQTQSSSKRFLTTGLQRFYRYKNSSESGIPEVFLLVPLPSKDHSTNNHCHDDFDVQRVLLCTGATRFQSGSAFSRAEAAQEVDEVMRTYHLLYPVAQDSDGGVHIRQNFSIVVL